jgi:cyanophycinase
MPYRVLVPVLALTVWAAVSSAPHASAPQTAPVATAAGGVAPEYGPANGTLLIVGGNMSDTFGLPQAFVRLAGGPSKKFVIVPTNGGNRNDDGTLKVYKEEAVVAAWKRRGLNNVVMLHTSDPKVADTEAFVKPLLDADAVWIDGGRQWNMVDSYANTRTVTALRGVLARGGVVAGTSAGATILGEYLVRGDTSGPDVVMTKEPNHQLGFGFLKRTAIDQHINARNRWDDLIPVIRAFPQYLGLGLSEDTAIVVRGDRFEVIGRWKVTVHDSTRAYQPWQKPYDVLSAGDVYNMQTRRIEKFGNGTTPGRGPGG